MQALEDRVQLQNEDPQHPPDQKERNNGSYNMANPLASSFRSAKLEHAAILAPHRLQGTRYAALIAPRPTGVTTKSSIQDGAKRVCLDGKSQKSDHG